MKLQKQGAVEQERETESCMMHRDGKQAPASSLLDELAAVKKARSVSVRASAADR